MKPCVWCHRPRHRDKAGRFVRTILVCFWAQYAQRVFIEQLEETMRDLAFFRDDAWMLVNETFIGAIPGLRS